MQIAEPCICYGPQVRPQTRKGSPLAKALNKNGVEKICNFLPISRRISETEQDMTKVIIND